MEALERTGHNHTARELGLSRVGLLKKMDRIAGSAAGIADIHGHQATR
jgi:hypothetical protein